MNELTELIKANQIATLVTFAAIISPVIVSIITLLAKRWELSSKERMDKWNVYYKDSSTAFSELLDSVGRWLVNPHSDEEVFNVLSALNRSFVYADIELANTLHMFFDKLSTWNINPSDGLVSDCQKYSFVVAKDINRVLTDLYQAKRKCTLHRLISSIKKKVFPTSQK